MEEINDDILYKIEQIHKLGGNIDVFWNMSVILNSKSTTTTTFTISLAFVEY